MSTKKQTFVASVERDGHRACVEHVEAKNIGEALSKAVALVAATHGTSYRVAWVKPFEGRRASA